jgi:C-terminal processing protease CtpA/Prc
VKSVTVRCLAILLAVAAGRPGWFGFGFSWHAPKSDGATSQAWLIVERVAAGSPASQAGLQPRDMIVSIDNKPVAFRSELEVLDFFAALRAGQPLKLTIRRGPATRQVTVVPIPMTDEQYRMFQKNFEVAKQGVPPQRPEPQPQRPNLRPQRPDLQP